MGEEIVYKLVQFEISKINLNDSNIVGVGCPLDVNREPLASIQKLSRKGKI